jgi:hypothetical protein
MLAEDNRILRYALRHFLEKHNLCVIESFDGENALSLAPDGPLFPNLEFPRSFDTLSRTADNREEVSISVHSQIA